MRFANFFIRSPSKRFFLSEVVLNSYAFVCLRKGFSRILYVGRALWSSEASPLIFLPRQLRKFYFPRRATNSHNFAEDNQYWAGPFLIVFVFYFYFYSSSTISFLTSNFIFLYNLFHKCKIIKKIRIF